MTDEEKVRSIPSATRPEVLKLYGLRDQALVEDDAYDIFSMFNRGSESQNHLDRIGVRSLLFAVQEAFGRPPFVPDECVDAVFKELQLDSDDPNTVSWNDFKSFCVYLVNAPITSMHEIVETYLKDNGLDFDQALILPELPLEILDNTGAFLTGFRKVCGDFHRGFFCTTRDGKKAQTIIFMKSRDDKDACVLLSGTRIGDLEVVEIRSYNGERFPVEKRKIKEEPSIFAQALASTWLFGEQVVKETGNALVYVDGQLKISDKVKEVNEEYKIGEKVGHVAEQGVGVLKVGLDKTKEGVGALDEKYQIADNVKHQTSKLLEKDTVRTGLGFMSGLFAKAKETVLELHDETVDILEKERAKNAEHDEHDGHHETHETDE
jgi:hypothetical protein